MNDLHSTDAANVSTQLKKRIRLILVIAFGMGLFSTYVTPLIVLTLSGAVFQATEGDAVTALVTALIVLALMLFHAIIVFVPVYLRGMKLVDALHPRLDVVRGKRSMRSTVRTYMMLRIIIYMTQSALILISQVATTPLVDNPLESLVTMVGFFTLGLTAFLFDIVFVKLWLDTKLGEILAQRIHQKIKSTGINSQEEAFTSIMTYSSSNNVVLGQTIIIFIILLSFTAFLFQEASVFKIVTMFWSLVYFAIIGIFIWLQKLIVINPTNQLREQLRILATSTERRGEMLPVATSNELGRVIHNYNLLINAINRRVEGLNQSSKEMHQLAQEFLEGFNAITTHVTEMVDVVGESSKNIDNMAQVIENGNKNVLELHATLNSLIKSSTEALNEMKESLTTINMLSLNVDMEAERMQRPAFKTVAVQLDQLSESISEFIVSTQKTLKVLESSMDTIMEKVLGEVDYSRELVTSLRGRVTEGLANLQSQLEDIRALVNTAADLQATSKRLRDIMMAFGG